MIRVSIDIGSNSCLLLILELKNGIHHTLESHAQITSLGKDLDKNKKFLTESLEATLSALKDFSVIIEKYDVKPDDVIVTATEASRIAQNFNELSTATKNSFGFNIQRISGEGEAYYTSLGVVRGILEPSSKTVVIMDIGGASTELIKVQLDEFKILDSISLPVGSVRASDWLLDNSFNEKMKLIFKKYSIEQFRTDKIICVAGTMTTIAAMLKKMIKYDEMKVQGLIFSRKELSEIISNINDKKSDDILVEYPICGKRASSIYGGALVAEVMADKLKVSNFEISTYGLRYGVAIEGRVNERFI